jgi:hypothetical protein
MIKVGIDSKEAAKLGIYDGLEVPRGNYCEQLHEKDEK